MQSSAHVIDSCQRWMHIGFQTRTYAATGSQGWTWQHRSSRLCLLWVRLQLLSFSDPFPIIFMNISTVYFSVISLLPCLNPTPEASLFLCPSATYFSLLNGWFKGLDLILMGFSFFTKWKNPFMSGQNDLWNNFILCSTSVKNDIIKMTTQSGSLPWINLGTTPSTVHGCSLCLFL